MRRLLVANRGEIARRIMRTARRLGLTPLAVHSDADATALHVREADAAVALPGDRPADTYLHVGRLVAAARALQADAVHPGYGFLSENADFAQAVLDAGLAWVGPPPEAMRALASKTAVKRLAAALDVPCIAGYAGEDQADVRFVREAERIGYPVMVKAAAGGGGRGLRVVRRAADLPAALASARSEARSSFGSDELLLERALASPRHVELQIAADRHGRCIHLGERDCSVQRRHQKLIEESPSPAVDAALRGRMAACAVRLAQRAGYVGVGTVEFLLAEGDFHLLEVNARLQVEHAVTEACTGIDLVEWQLRLAQGEPLPLAQGDVAPRGHAIEVRLVAEDESFAPHAGVVRRFVAPPGDGVRVDHALEDGTIVPPWYDALLAKLVVHAPTREAAIERLVEALRSTAVLGVPTGRRLLIECLRDPAFRRGEATVDFLDTRGGPLRAALADAERALRPQLAAALWFAQAGAPSSLAVPFERPMRLRHRDDVLDARVRASGPQAIEVRLGAATTAVRALPPAGGDAWRLVVDGVATPVRWARIGAARWHVQAGDVDAFVDDASFEPPPRAASAAASDVRAPFSGRVVAVHAVEGRTIAAGETLVVIESMKLEQAVSATCAGTVARLAVQPGQQVAPQQLLLTLAAP